MSHCACGVWYVAGDDSEEARHARLHSDNTTGPLLPALNDAQAIDSQNGLRIVRIGDRSDERVRSAASQLANTACQETSDVPPGYDGSITDGELVVFALLDGMRAVGFVLIGFSSASWPLRWIDETHAELVEESPNRSPRIVVGRVWIAASYRRLGYGQGLMRAVASAHGVSVNDMAFETPLTDAGRALVHSVCGEYWYAKGDAFTMRDIIVAVEPRSR